MSNVQVNEVLMGLRRRYAAALPEKVSKVATTVESFLAAPAETASGDLAHRAVHSLIGSSGTYGFPDLSGLACSAESLLEEARETGIPLSPAERFQLRELLRRMSALACSAASAA